MTDFFNSLIQIMMPFMAAFIFAYILEPITKRLVNAKVPKGIAALMTLFIGLGAGIIIFLLLLSLIQREAPLIKSQFPMLIQNAQNTLDPLLAKFNITLDWVDLKNEIHAHFVSKITDNADLVVAQTTDALIKSSGSILGLFANSVLVIFVLFYLLLEWDHFLSLIANLVPFRFRETFFGLVSEVDELLSHYLRGQILLMLVLAIFYSIGLSLIGLKSAIPLGVFTGLVSFIPYVGIAISILLTLLSAILQFGPGDALLAVLVLYGVGQMLEQFFLTPRLVGESIGLHPVAVVLAIMVLGQFLGFLGILLAFPISAICLVGIRHLLKMYRSSEFYNSKS